MNMVNYKNPILPKCFFAVSSKNFLSNKLFFVSFSRFVSDEKTLKPFFSKQTDKRQILQIQHSIFEAIATLLNRYTRTTLGKTFYSSSQNNLSPLNPIVCTLNQSW